MTAPTTSGDRGAAVRTDWPLAVGMSAVGLAAAASSYAALQDLALRTSWWPWLSWLLPVTVDAYALTAVRVWLGRSTRSRTARAWAKANAIGGIALSVAGNAVDHAAAAGVIPVSWPLIVAVSAIPPVVLGLLVHMAHLRHQPTTDAPANSTPAATDQQPQAEDGPVPLPPVPGQPPAAPDAPKQQRPRRSPAAGKRRRTLPPGKSDDELISAARQHMADGGEASATWLMKTYGIGTGRAARIRDAAAQRVPRHTPPLTVVPDVGEPPLSDTPAPPPVGPDPEPSPMTTDSDAPLPLTPPADSHEQVADEREEEKAL
ncbi:hypothetical protein SMD11_5613 [Streptomyces albireticuli]|uniref:DUF2637 domain-containing protein n=1 Tax=Streptomyces albireticuli TaxID=1940 RepID=A0A1Z2LA84_9ACTN|nr:DUF2637 domain-containing protein [Streptomyces albireticuli]ARZ71192.1 hypothetical protein SMD11_5613 [Streptomyces albireticuli]